MNQAIAPETHRSATGLSLIKVSGADRLNFLQGQLTQDTRLVKPQQPLLAGWPNAKGRLNFVAWLLDWQDALWLVLPAEIAEAAAKRLKLYVLRAKVNIEAVQAQVLFGAPLISIKTDKVNVSNCFCNENVYQYRPIAGDERWLTVALESREPLAEDTLEWQQANIEAGLPWVRAATLESFVPQMLNLDLLGAISFTKGCYIGQEIVARTQNLGRIKRRMYRFTAQQAAQPGDQIYAGGRPAGEVVDAITVDNECMLLAVARIEALREPLSLDPEGALLLKRQPLPYAVPETLAD